MEKIRNPEHLYDKLDQDFAWRRKELTFINKNIKSTKEHNRQTHLRSGIMLLYAHWEGFIKNAAENYLKFVATKGLKYIELNNCFIALALREKLDQFETSSKASVHTQIIDFMFGELSQGARIPFENIIKTQSKLTSERLKEILITIGIDYSPYELKNKFIDAKLLQIRNAVAHGQRITIDEEDFADLYKEITSIIENIKTDILNAAVLESYKRQRQDETDTF